MSDQDVCQSKLYVPDLPPHSDSKQGEEVHDQNWPIHGNVESHKEGADQGDQCGFCRG